MYNDSTIKQRILSGVDRMFAGTRNTINGYATQTQPFTSCDANDMRDAGELLVTLVCFRSAFNDGIREGGGRWDPRVLELVVAHIMQKEG